MLVISHLKPLHLRASSIEFCFSTSYTHWACYFIQRYSKAEHFYADEIIFFSLATHYIYQLATSKQNNCIVTFDSNLISSTVGILITPSDGAMSSRPCHNPHYNITKPVPDKIVKINLTFVLLSNPNWM